MKLKLLPSFLCSTIITQLISNELYVHHSISTPLQRFVLWN